MAEIKLTNSDKVCLVDDEDFERVSVFKWRVSIGYARTVEVGKTHKTRKHFDMHRLVLNFPPEFVDHVNQNRLDNRKSNLRLSNNKFNRHNSKMNRNNSTGFRGVSFHKKTRKFISHIGIDGKLKHFGYFHSKELAGLVADCKLIENLPLDVINSRLNYPHIPEITSLILSMVRSL
jgi:hypothetical protein